MRTWEWLRADLTRPEIPTGREELTFLTFAPIFAVVVSQIADPAPLGTLLLLVPAVVAFVLRGLAVRHYPAELFALVVIVSVGAAIGIDGDLEGAFFLTVTMVLYISWALGSLVRALLVAVVATLSPWFVATRLVPEAGIGWYPWCIAAVFLFILGRTLQRQRTLIMQLEAARQALAAQAVAEERRRIARELHDLAGHTVAAMVLHVTGARHVLRRNIDDAEAALRDAEEVGRTSLDQIRHTVAALRTDERGTDRVLHDSDDLPTLVEGYRRAGLEVDAHLHVNGDAIDGPVGVALHRITREALANVARHAPTNKVRLQVTTTGRHVRLLISDHGRPSTAPDPHEPHFGLIGMAERARAVGGELDAGPTADGWRVSARLPLTASGQER